MDDRVAGGPSVISVLEFVNRVRALQGLPACGGLALRGIAPDGEHCIISAALGVPIDLSVHPEWSARGCWVMRFARWETAWRVGIGMDLPWLARPPQVCLPDALVDLAVSENLDVVVGDESGFVRGWWVPDDDGFPCFLTPTEPLIDDGGLVVVGC